VWIDLSLDAFLVVGWLFVRFRLAHLTDELTRGDGVEIDDFEIGTLPNTIGADPGSTGLH
jgi:hypothetical protein